MKTLDYVLYEEPIAAFNPERVIVYLSAFDMTGSPELFSLPLAPSRPSAIWSIYSRLRAAGLTRDELAPNMHAFVFSQLLPEYRYSFVYRALLRQWFGAAPRPAPASQRLPEFSSYYDAQWLDYNFSFFRDFMEFCRARGIEVLVAEGQINPTAGDARDQESQRHRSLAPHRHDIRVCEPAIRAGIRRVRILCSRIPRHDARVAGRSRALHGAIVRAPGALKPYSERSRSRGSTFDAARAGSHVAPAATTSMTSAADDNTSGSDAAVPKSSD